LPSVNKLYTEFKARGFEVVLVSFREDPAKVKRTVQERGYVAPVLLDESGEVTGKLYGVWGPPTVYVIDGRGQLLGRIVGARDWSGPAARRFVQSVVEGSPPR
jgi:peroxiredoxin